MHITNEPLYAFAREFAIGRMASGNIAWASDEDSIRKADVER